MLVQQEIKVYSAATKQAMENVPTASYESLKKRDFFSLFCIFITEVFYIFLYCLIGWEVSKFYWIAAIGLYNAIRFSKFLVIKYYVLNIDLYYLII